MEVKMFKQRTHEPAPETKMAQHAMRSLINDSMIDETLWAVSIVWNKKEGNEQHAFIIIEGMHEGQFTVFRSDLFLKNTSQNKASAPSSMPRALNSLLDMFAQLSNLAHGQAFIRLKEISIEELEELARTCEYQSKQVEHEKIKVLFHRLIEEGSKVHVYHVSGDNPVFSSNTSTLKHQNCVSWCQNILKETIGYQVGSSWAVIKRPGEIVKSAIRQAKETNSTAQQRK
jgi:hypothetical protein